MKVCVVGAGHVGLVTAACLSDMGNSVVCLDVDLARVASLQQGQMPSHEPGLAERVRTTVQAELRKRSVLLPLAVVSNPEFLKEGAAFEDFMRADRIVIGAEDEQSTLLMRALYAPFLRNRDRLLVMDVRSARLTKYLSNAMLATRISFMNEVATLAECVGADIEQVRLGIGRAQALAQTTHVPMPVQAWAT